MTAPILAGVLKPDLVRESSASTSKRRSRRSTTTVLRVFGAVANDVLGETQTAAQVLTPGGNPGSVAGGSVAQARNDIEVAIAIQVGELEIIGSRIAEGAGESDERRASPGGRAEHLERGVALLNRHEVVVAVAVDVADVPFVRDVSVVEDDGLEAEFSSDGSVQERQHQPAQCGGCFTSSETRFTVFLT